MDDPEKVAAYTRAGLVDGVMAPVYLFHCQQVCDVIRPGDTVIDVGCGPGTQLAMIAALNSDTQFVGVDLSDEMLQRAHRHMADLKLKNVRLHHSDITQLSGLQDGSADAVFSTVALHHLPTVDHLERAFSEINRVLKPGGGLYLVDFGHLKAEKSIEYFARQYSDRQPELFTLDYLYSLRAAFYPADFRLAHSRHLKSHGKVYSALPLHYMIAAKSSSRRGPDPALKENIARMYRKMPRYHQKDFKHLTKFFQWGGLRANI